jgi:hypothetical protein
MRAADVARNFEYIMKARETSGVGRFAFNTTASEATDHANSSLPRQNVNL